MGWSRHPMEMVMPGCVLSLQNVTKGARHKIVISIQKLKERQNLLKSLERVSNHNSFYVSCFPPQTHWEQLTRPFAICYWDIVLYLIAPSSNSNQHSLPLGAFKYLCGVLLFIGVFLSSLLHYLFIILGLYLEHCRS